MRTLLVVMFVSLAGCSLNPTSAFDPGAVVREARAADERYSEAAARGDYEAMAGFVTPDFVYIDISGNRMTPERMLARRGEDHRRVVHTETLGEEAVALSDSVVVMRLHSTDLSHYYGGLPRRSESRTTIVWSKGQDAQWRMAAAQANIVMRPAFPVKVRTTLTRQRLEELAGEYTLDTEAGLPFILTAGEDALHAEIPGQFSQMAFYPEGDAAFFATARPFELRFESPDELTLITWSQETRGRRVGR